MTEYLNATDGVWHFIEPFVFADGTASPPALLRDPADQNYLGDGVRIAGLTLASISFLVIISSALWVWIYRHHSLVLAGQPIFLLALCGGCLMEAVAIVLISFDESHGWTVEALTGICKALPWFIVLGHIVTYNMLFTKVNVNASLVYHVY